MPKIDRLLDRGIAFAQSGRNKDASNLFQVVLQEEPKNLIAWKWYIQSISDDERIQAFDEYLRIFPNDQKAARYQASLIRRRNDSLKKQVAESLQTMERLKLGNIQTVKTKDLLIRIIALASLLFISLFVIISIQAASKSQVLEQARQALETQNNALRVSNAAFRTRNIELAAQFDTLLGDYNRLADEYADLLENYQWLEGIAVTPPYILTNGRMVTLAFTKLDETIIYWEVSFDALELDLQKGNLARNEISRNPREHSLYLSNTNTNETYSVVDVRPFVNSFYFEKVISQLYEQSKTDEAFLREVWNIVAQLTAYSSEISETPRYPLETLLAGGGDCEDTAILFASMLEAAPVNWDIQFVYMDLYNPTRPLDLNHVAIYVKTGSQTYIIETTSKESMEPFSEGVTGWYFGID